MSAANASPLRSVLARLAASAALTCGLAAGIALAAPQDAQAASMGKVAKLECDLTRCSSYAVDTTGNLWTWGEVLKDPARKGNVVPQKLYSGIADVADGERHSLYLGKDGVLWASGVNWDGELGVETRVINQYVTERVKVMEGVAAIDAGYGNSAAIKKDGSLWLWGNNEHGQLGIGSADEKSHETPTKVLDDVASVSLGWHCVAAVKTDGSLWTCGYGMGGCLGGGSTDNSHSFVKVMDGVKAVSCGFESAAAIKADGSLWTWGCNYYGQLGRSVCRFLEPTPGKVMDGVRSVSAGQDYMVAVKKDGTLWAWGQNTAGQLGDGTYVEKAQPVKVLSGVKFANAGCAHVIALKNDGSLWGTGGNSCGQLGLARDRNYGSFTKAAFGAKEPARLKKGATIVKGSLTYTVLSGKNDVSIKVTPSNRSSIKVATVPSLVKDKKGIPYRVSSVAASGFKNCPKLCSVNLKSIFITNIGASAFSGCGALEHVEGTSERLNTIGANAFYGTKSLTVVDFSKSESLKNVSDAFKGAGASNGSGLTVYAASNRCNQVQSAGGNPNMTVTWHRA